SGETGEGGYVWLNGYMDTTTTGDVDIVGTISADGLGTTVGDGGTIDIRPDGDLHLEQSGILRANGRNGRSRGHMWLIPSGKAIMDGKIIADASGTDAYGGSIEVWADKAVSSGGDWSANGGSGPDAAGGSIDFSSGYESLITSGAMSMKATAGGGGRGGEVS